MEYINNLKNNSLHYKKILDSIIEVRKGQHIGNGYKEIVIKRENIENFINDLNIHHFIIDAVSWWFYCSELDKKSKYGYGGPKSKYFSGWFSELCHDFDEMEMEHISEIMGDNKLNYVEIINSRFKDIVYNKKTVKYFDGGFLTFQRDTELIPGFSILVPEEWKNNEIE